jgi:hexosaminidase
VPVEDGTYALRAGAAALTAEVRRTPDGYVTLRTADGCLEVRGGKLTLNTPLQPGVELTAQTCDATNTVQRWELEQSAEGYRLVNAITRMVVHVTDDGRLVQFPPDQRPAAVWHLPTVH